MSLETISFNIPKKPASEVLKSFLDLVTEIFPDKRIVSFQIDSAVNPNHAYISNSSQLMSASDLLANEKILSALEFFKSHTFIDIKTIIVNSNVCFKQGDNTYNQHNPKISFQGHPSQVYDRISIEIFRTHPNAEEILTKIIESIEKHYTILDSLTIQNSFLDALQSEKNKVYESKILEYEKLFLNEKKFLDEIKKEWNTLTTETQDRLQKRYEESQAKLENDFLSKEDKLKQEVAEFEERKKQFDDRERTVVRRDLLKKIEEIIHKQATFNLSDKTIEKRGIVNTICAWVLGFSGLGITSIASLFLINYFTKNTIDWNLLIPSSAFAVIFGSTLIFYLRWSSQWYREHADIEFSNQVFSRDMLRASWIVEMFFEWKEQKQQFDMPVEIYNAISKNLFNERSSSKQINHPIEDLLKITSKFSKVKLGKEGIEVENAAKDKG